MKRSFAKIRFMLPVLFKIRREHERGRTGGTSQLCALGGPFCDLLSRPLTDPVLSRSQLVIQPTRRQWIFYFSFSSIRYRASSCKRGVTCDSRSLILRLLRSPRDPLAHAAL